MATFGNNEYDLTNAIIPSTLTARNNPVKGKELKFFIKDDNDEWVDFSDRCSDRGKNKLLNHTTFKYATEKRGGLPLLETSVGSIELDNSDGLFDSEVEGLTAENGSAADFSNVSQGKTLTAWRDREVKFELYLNLIDDSIMVKPMGIFIIKSISMKIDKNSKVFIITFQSRMNALKSMDASVVKEGKDWYRNKSIPFLIRELLKTRFAESDGSLPDSFYINNLARMAVPEDIGTAYSSFGVPPQDANSQNLEQDYIRCADIWIWNTGTVSSSSDYSYTLTSSTNWTTASNIKPKVGDVIVIKDSSNDNDGNYKIKAINGTTITLYSPLRGTTESGMSYTISRIFFIFKDTELWEFIPEDNAYNQLATWDLIWSTGISFHAVPYYIKIATNNKLYVVESLIPDQKYVTSVGTYGGSLFENYTSRTYDTCGRVYSWNGTSYSAENIIGGGLESGPFIMKLAPWGIFSGNGPSNVFIPYNQLVTSIKTATSVDYGKRYLYKEEDYNDETGTYAADPEPGNLNSKISTTVYTWPNYVPKGFWRFDDYQADYDTNEAAGMLITWDTGPRVVYAPDWGTSGSLVYLFCISPSAARGDLGDPPTLDTNIRARIYDIAAGSTTSCAQAITGTRSTGVCIKYNSYNQRCIVSVATMIPPNTSHSITQGRFYYLESSGGFTYIGATAGFIHQDFEPYEYNSGTGVTSIVSSTIVLTGGTSKMYQLMDININDGALSVNSIVRIDSSPLVKLTTGSGDATHNDVYMFHKYENRLMKWDYSTETLTSLNNGQEVVQNEGNISCNLLVDKYTRANNNIIYGVSWIGEDPITIGDLKLPNKGLLWKSDSYITSIIELADFDGLSVADAIGKLAQACNHLAFFNSYGDFYFIPKEVIEEPDYNINYSDYDSLVIDNLNLDYGYDEIYNQVTVVPYRTAIQDIEYELILVFRDENEEQLDYSKVTYINSLNNIKRTLRLICTEPGKVSEIILFKWLVEFSEIEGRISSDVSSSDREIYLESVFGGDAVEGGMQTGDFIIFRDSDDDTPVVREIAGGKGYGNLSSTTASSAEVNVSDASFYKVGDKVTLNLDVSGTLYRHKNTISSIDGIAITLTNDVPYTITATSDMFAPVRNNESIIGLFSSPGINIESGSEISVVSASSGDTSDSMKGWSSDGVTFITEVDSTTVFYVNDLRYIAKNTYVKVANEEPILVSSINKISNKVTLSTALGSTPSIGDNIGVYFNPSSNEFREVPKSGFEIKIDDSEAYFKAGDVILVKTDGLKLEADERSRKLAISLDSKSRFGKLDYPTIKNRFLDSKLAEVIVQDILNFYKYPHRHLEISIPLLPLIDLIRVNRLSSFKITSKTLFPTAQDYSRIFYLRSFNIDVKSDKIDLQLIEKDYY